MTPDEEKRPDVGANGISGRLTAAESAEFARGLASLTEGSLPLPGGLRALAGELTQGRVRSALLAVASRIEQGEPLHDAIDAEGRRFPGHLRGLILAGVRSGRLAEVLGGYVAAHLTGADLKRSIWLGLAYPAMLLVGMTGVLVFVCVSVVQDYDEVFQQFGVALPVITRRLLTISRWVNGVTAGMVAGLAVLVLAIGLIARFAMDAVQRRQFLVGLPLFGPAWRLLSLAEFSRVLALLLEGQVPLKEALPLAGEGSLDSELEEACREVAERVERGEWLSEAMSDVNAFPPTLTQVVVWAEGRRTLPEALGMAAEMFEARARSRVRFGQILVGIVVMVLALVEIGFLQLSLMLPMTQIISKLSG
ncbi:type II secretion system F family protein [Isosphaeraceae bacterium EP7]